MATLIHKTTHPNIYKMLALVWEDNIPELAFPSPFIIEEATKGWDLNQINHTLGTLTEDEMETFAFGEYYERQELVKSKPELNQADDLAETFFEELM
jgi:hypothetical protein